MVHAKGGYLPRLLRPGPLSLDGGLYPSASLFRASRLARLSLSMDGEEEQECMNHKDFPDFLFFLVQATKQMRYIILIEGRIFFGDNVFTTFRAAKKYQRKFGNLKYTKIWTIRMINHNMQLNVICIFKVFTLLNFEYAC